MGQDGTKLDQMGSKWNQIWNEFMIKCDKMGPKMDQETYQIGAKVPNGTK